MQKELPIFDETCRWLDIYFSGKEPDFTPPLSMRTTPFRKAVWEIMLTIPYGQTMTYGEIAGIIAEQRGIDRMSAQAVGGAVGHNSISLIIPCHRVIGTDGSLTGYAGALTKRHSSSPWKGHVHHNTIRKRYTISNRFTYICLLSSLSY